MKRINLLILTSLFTITIFSFKKSEKNGVSENNETVEIAKKDSNAIDLDLSRMNYNMMSSIVFDIMVVPENYVDKRIKTAGNFYTDEYEGKRYFSVLIWDNTGCCPAGLDFIPPEGMKYPENFPEADERISVTGVLKYLKEDGQTELVFQAEEIVRE